MKKLYKVPFIAVISVEVFAPLLAGSPTKHTENDIFKKVESDETTLEDPYEDNLSKGDNGLWDDSDW